MFLDRLGKVEHSKFYVELAIRHANARCKLLKQKLPVKERLLREKKVGSYRLQMIDKYLGAELNRLIACFPDFESIPVFYLELVKLTTDYEATTSALKKLDWLRRSTRSLAKAYIDRISKRNDIKFILSSEKAFYGRLFGLARKVDPSLEVLETVRKVMREYPVVKTSLFTVAIAGFPNVGKTTLLFKLTGSQPEIKNYAFTTKGINTAYMSFESRKVQLLDTPGTLDRIEKMNNLEKQSFLAIQHLANCIVYVFDVTESYPLDDQIKLYLRLKELDKPMIVYASKTDISKDNLALLSDYEPITDLQILQEKLKSLAEKSDILPPPSSDS
ncbi:MAG: GTPase [Candidatus Woesearchaeota archaeon]